MSRLKKIYPLTSVRFFAASSAVFHHTAQAFLPAVSVMPTGHLLADFVFRFLRSFTFSVSFFFLLSGYVLSLVYLRDGGEVRKAKFFAARFARLYPLYLAMIVLDSFSLLAAKIARYGLADGVAKTAWIFEAHLMMLQAWYPTRLLRIDPPSWALCAEVFFYVFFPVLGVRLWRLRGRNLGMTALTVYVGGQLLVWWIRPHVNVQTVLFWPPLQLSTFALGILLARWQTLQQDKGNIATVPEWKANVVMGLSVGGVLLCVFLLPYFHVADPYSNGLLAPVLAGIIWSLSVVPTRLSRLLSASWLVGLGNASYALYLVHIPMLKLFQHFHCATKTLYPVYWAACIGLSLLSFHAFETPVRLWLLERLHSRSLGTAEAASIT